MDKSEIEEIVKKYIEDNLNIEIESGYLEHGYGGKPQIRVSLRFTGERRSFSSYTIAVPN